MTLTSITPIKPGSRRAQAQAFVRQGVHEGLSGRNIQRQLQSVGFGYARARLVEDVANYVKTEGARSLISGTAKHRFAPEASIGEYAGVQRENFRYVVSITTTDPATGAPVFEHVTVVSDTFDRIASVEARATDALKAERYAFESEPHQVNLIEIWHRQGAGYDRGI